jgi:hypothetical protein
LPFGVAQVRRISHPKRTAINEAQSTAISALLLGFLEFSNRLLAA